MNTGWTFYLDTFGCKVNQYESQALREAWTALGGVETPSPAKADWIVVNSCAVTAQAVSDVCQSLRRLVREAPKAAIVVTGCAASATDTPLASLPGVTALIPQSDKQRLLAGPPCSPQSEHTNTALPAEAFPPFRISAFVRARPILKVQDGCSHHCTYCIVPLLRGPSRSRPLAELVAEAERLLAAGHRELVLSGINLHQYTRAEAGDFWDVLTALDQTLAPRWTGKARLRISSLDPAQLGPKALDSLAAARLVCPHLHLSLQSGSPDVLRRMGRGHYQPERILDEVTQLRRLWPLCGLGADILMGFPGESNSQCEETLTLVQALCLSYGHVFPFSARPGTAAAQLADMPAAIKQERARRARQVIQQSRTVFLASIMQLPEFVVAPDLTPDLTSDLSPDLTPDLTPDLSTHFLPAMSAQKADAAATPPTGRPAKHATVGPARGISEHYLACRLATQLPSWHSSPHAGPHDLIRVRPVAIEQGRVLVVPLS